MFSSTDGFTLILLFIIIHAAFHGNFHHAAYIFIFLINLIHKMIYVRHFREHFYLLSFIWVWQMFDDVIKQMHVAVAG